MSFSKVDLDSIKNKILISSEIQKKTKIIKKGKDFWCCCPFHKEKTPSCKINDDTGSFYCFGCGAKGDIFTLYTDLYNYKFQEAVKELAQRAGIKIEFKDYLKSKKENAIYEILDSSCEWFQNNLNNKESAKCREYISSRKLSKETINEFKIGYSFNTKTTLYDYLISKSFKHEDIIKSNVVKINNKNLIKDYFYKRLIFPILNESGKVIGFGGRSFDNLNPKYLNSPESSFFQKRKILYNLSKAKFSARKKNNLLICEGYMDVISLYQNGIKSVVAPLGTSLTEEQLNLAWNYSSKPTIMFDGDTAGLRASFKSALMSLPLVTSKKFLQFITLSNGYDPDSFINHFSFDNLVKLLKKPLPLVNFIFEESIKAFSLDSADKKIVFDKYLEELIENIKDKKIKFFYQQEFKSLFFERIKKNNNLKSNLISKPKKIDQPLNTKQLFSFIAASLNHLAFRREIIEELLKTQLFAKDMRDLLLELSKPSLLKINGEEIKESIKNSHHLQIIDESLNSSIYQLFPYSSPDYESSKSLKEIKKSCENLNTRLLKLEKINKSLDGFVNNTNQLKWDELVNMKHEISSID